MTNDYDDDDETVGSVTGDPHSEDDEEEGPGAAEFFGKHRWEICCRCSGEGKHVNPSIDGHGISPEEFREDPDFEEAYFSGLYDVTCYECHGSGKVKVADWRRLTADEAHAVWLMEEEEALDRSISRMERWSEYGLNY